MTNTRHIFIIGSKGIPARYGGFETFVEKLTQHRRDTDIQYHVACMADANGEFEHNGARCFHVRVPHIGPAKAVYYDVAALRRCCAYLRKQDIRGAVVYVLACRIGPFGGHFRRRLAALDATLVVNPDGHEWQRRKWNAAIRRYWKWSERLMVKHAGLLICDSKAIEAYIRAEYARYRPKTTFIAYGTEDGALAADAQVQAKAQAWYEKHGLRPGEYYLSVGRFVPENNYETILREYMRADTARPLAIITDASGRFLERIRLSTGFEADSRIRFVGTVYDQALLARIRQDARASLHGHEVGGTNPSLLEALACTKANLVLDVPFNREVCESAALYWTKEEGSLAQLIKTADMLPPAKIAALGAAARQRIADAYNWPAIVAAYEETFRRLTR